MKQKHNIDRILENGLELIREKGYHNTGIVKILKVNQIPKGSFYNFFKSKEDFAIKALQKYTAQQIKWVEGILSDNSRTAFERLQYFYIKLIAGNLEENYQKGCLVGNMAQEMGGLSEAISQQADESLKMITGVIAQCIQEGQEAGEIRDDYSASKLAKYIHNSFYGFLLRSKAGQDKKHFDIFMEMMFNFIRN
jgi:TetR/AcrR family transcriptional repressor of nem operon